MGAGGLGSPAGLYLAAAGVGTIGIADGAVVDLPDLQRQIAHGTASLGTAKPESFAGAAARLNPDVSVVAHPAVTPDQDPFRGYDVILDCSDNFETRFLVNDRAVARGLPLVSAAAVRFEGQLTTVLPGEGAPCYRCLYPAPPPEGAVPASAQVGVFGAVPGALGALQAVEAVKVLLGIGEPLRGRLLLMDLLAGECRVVRYRRDPACPAH